MEWDTTELGARPAGPRSAGGSAAVAVYVATGIALAIGVVARLKGLGAWSLANDEFLMAKSVGQILEYGVPRFDSGGYYVRGIAYQYLQALGLLLSPLSAEWSLRLVNSTLALLAIPALYLLARRIGGTLTACYAVILFSLSVWEIETARYVRMYAPFQTIFLWYCVAFFSAVVERNRGAYKWMLVLSVASLFIYEGGIFLVLLNFAPYLLRTLPFRIRRLVIPGAILLGAVGYFRTNFRRLGVSNYLPADLPEETVTSVDWVPLIDDPLLFVTTFPNPLWILAFVGVCGVMAASCFAMLRHPRLAKTTKAVLASSAVLALLNLFGVVAGLWTVSWLLGWLRREHGRVAAARRVVYALAAVFAFWFAYGLTTTRWYVLFPEESFNVVKKILVVLFKYPDVYLKILHEWMLGMPTTTLWIGLIVTVGLVLSEVDRAPRWSSYRLIAALIVALSLIIGALPMIYYGARYTLFLYPLLLMLVAATIDEVGRRIPWRPLQTGTASLLLVGGFLFVADDFSWYHVRNIDRAEVNFRLIYDVERHFHYWSRIDYKTPGQAVNRELASTDTVVVSRAGAVCYYLDRTDYVFQPEAYVQLEEVLASGGTRELWTNARIVYSQEALFDLIERTPGAVWVIAHSEEFPYQDEAEAAVAEKYGEYLFYRSLDGRIDVYRIDLGTSGEPARLRLQPTGEGKLGTSPWTPGEQVPRS